MNHSEIVYLQEALGIELAFASSRPEFYALALPDGRAYLFPTNSIKAFTASLSLYQPQRIGARVFGRLLAIRPSLARWLLQGMNINGLDKWQVFFSDLFQKKDVIVAISLGTPSAHRKPVIQILTENGKALGFAKIGWNETTAHLVEREAKMLERLPSHTQKLLFPRIIFWGQYQERILCLQSAPTEKGLSLQQRLTPSIVDAVIELAEVNRYDQPLYKSVFWNDLDRHIEQMEDDESRQGFRRNMQTILGAIGKWEIPFHASHGDLSPWNAMQTGGSLYLYDWEYASFDKPAGYDLCHFLVQVHTLVKKASAADVYSLTLKSLQNEPALKYWRRLGLKFHPAFLMLYLLERSVFSSVEKLPSLNPSRFLDQLMYLCQTNMK